MASSTEAALRAQTTPPADQAAGGPTQISGGLTQRDFVALLEWFWHPVATSSDLSAAGGVLGTRLLGRELAVARLESGRIAAYTDRCPHRSTRLSVGCVDGEALRCAYHGWRWAADGHCVEIPSAPAQPIPSRFRQDAYEADERYGLIWVRLRSGAATEIPTMPGALDPTMRVVAGDPYTWPTSAPRRVENFVDLAHFAWVHDGTLGDRDCPVPPEAEVERDNAELRFSFVPPPMDDIAETALVGSSWYRMPMPLTVNIEFEIAGRPGVRRHLWMTACPLDTGTCRSYWTVSRNDEHERPDAEFLEFQHVVLEEDLPVVCNQVPPEIPLDPLSELHVKADKISLEYRRWLRELTAAAGQGPEHLNAALRQAEPVQAAAG